MNDKPKPPRNNSNDGYGRVNNGYGRIEEGRVQKGGSNTNPSQYFQSRPAAPTGSGKTETSSTKSNKH